MILHRRRRIVMKVLLMGLAAMAFVWAVQV
jgi:hypothetical protein